MYIAEIMNVASDCPLKTIYAAFFTFWVDFYSIYVDDLVHILKSSGVGCYYFEKFAAALMYANDMTALSPFLKGLRKLLLLCETYCLE